ncbi:MAG: hypothetical protein HY336_02640 [Candidatus Doudnabacteria bacterium]|nr:hypothetical protein [Candidatus Doudnabacteria bacterium]
MEWLRPNSRFQIPDSKQGFSLFEAIVATAVFAFVVSSVLGVYVSVLQLDSKTRSQRAVTQNARFIMEFLAKEIRNGDIDYAAYPGGIASVTNEIYIKNQMNEAERIYLDSQRLMLTKLAGTTALNSSSTLVANVAFYVSPNTNPLTTTRPPTVNQQPSVTIVLELVSNYGKKDTDKAKINMQSTFTVRAYPSRLP